MKPISVTISAGLVLAAVLAVCGSARADTPGANDAEFFMMLNYKKAAMLPDGYRAVAILARGLDDLKDPAKCRDYLVEKKIARSSWGNDPKEPLTKGRLAYMVCQALGIKGGLIMRLTGPTERYCLLECAYLEFIINGADYQNCTGGELTSVIDRADAYQLKEAQAAGKQPKAVDPLEKYDIGKVRTVADKAKDKDTDKAKPAAPAAAPAEAKPTTGAAAATEAPAPVSEKAKPAATAEAPAAPAAQ
jgi:hypothetical protein